MALGLLLYGCSPRRRCHVPLLERAPWLSIYPGLAIFVLVLAFNLLGDALRDQLDPRLRGR